MKIIHTVAEWRMIQKEFNLSSENIGFVPTMGNLHAGHQSLLQRSQQENTVTVLSIFVNPTQFNNTDDLAKYPRTMEQDYQLATDSGVDFIFAPTYSEMYADNYRYQVCENELSHLLEGMHRPGHFSGMLTMVMKLLQLIKPTRAYFGEKDFQQLQLIKEMVSAFFIDTEIIACPTMRDKNGLAMSSRNNRLTEQQYQLALNFPRLLRMQLPLPEIIDRLTNLGFTVDYIEEFQGRRFGAVSVGDVRLIDNFLIAN